MTNRGLPHRAPPRRRPLAVRLCGPRCPIRSRIHAAPAACRKCYMALHGDAKPGQTQRSPPTGPRGRPLNTPPPPLTLPGASGCRPFGLTPGLAVTHPASLPGTPGLAMIIRPARCSGCS